MKFTILVFPCLLGSATILCWDLRLKILKGAAQGLAFLHTKEREVILRDFKASNILLDGVRFYHHFIIYASH